MIELLLPYAEYGVGIFSITALVYAIVFFGSKTKEFIGYLSTRDEEFLGYIKTRDEQVNKLVTNHFHDNGNLMRDIIASNERRSVMDEQRCEVDEKILNLLRDIKSK